MESLNEVWSHICDYTKTQISEVAFNVWIDILSLVSLDAGEATLFVRTSFQKKIIKETYYKLLEDAFFEVLKFNVKIKIVTEEDMPTPETLPADTSHDYEYTFENFIVGPSNRFAHAASVAVSENPAITYNPLFIHGNSGLGKTHLLNAVCKRIHQKFPQKNIVSVSAENFTRELIDSINRGNMAELRNKYRTADVLLVDDIQFIAGKESTQEEFFNTFNTLYQDKKQMVLTSDRPPKDIATLDNRIRSRFEQGIIADIQPPDFETRVGIVERKAQMLKFNLPEEIVFYIAEQVKTNIRQIEGVVKKLQAYTLLDNEMPTIGVAQNAIRDIRNDDQPEPITVKNIISEVSRTYAVSAEDILSKKHDAPFSYARQVAMYVVREVTQMSVAQIGTEFGGRDHSTVVYGIQKIKNLMKNNQKERDTINDIIKNMQNR
ncbi:MAG: chromosomal replication initiation protein DnaA [Clostridiales bacterium 43-6]|nr:MAG: chromosomal replication initiation protein DnaA [Clostridiales bacterium 43-6]